MPNENGNGSLFGPVSDTTDLAVAEANTIAALKAIASGGQRVVAAAPVYSSAPLLRMLKGVGTWVYGQDENDVEEDSVWAVNPFGMQHGWVQWEADPKVKQRKAGEVMVSVSKPKPDITALPAPGPGNKWEEQGGLQLKCLTGTDAGTMVLFKSSSIGGMDMFVEVVDKISKRIDDAVAEGRDDVIACVRLESSSYDHPSYGKIFKPVMTIKGWMSMKTSGGGGKPTEPAQAAVQRQAAPPEPAQAAQAEAAQPVRRRRNAAAAAATPAGPTVSSAADVPWHA